jgi:hypothetical protein
MLSVWNAALNRVPCSSAVALLVQCAVLLCVRSSYVCVSVLVCAHRSHEERRTVESGVLLCLPAAARVWVLCAVGWGLVRRALIDRPLGGWEGAATALSPRVERGAEQGRWQTWSDLIRSGLDLA